MGMDNDLVQLLARQLNHFYVKKTSIRIFSGSLYIELCSCKIIAKIHSVNRMCQSQTQLKVNFFSGIDEKRIDNYKQNIEFRLSLLKVLNHFLPLPYFNFFPFSINLTFLQPNGSSFMAALISIELALTDAGFTTIGIVMCCELTRIFDDFLPFKLFGSDQALSLSFFLNLCRILSSYGIKSWSIEDLNIAIRLAVKVCHKLLQMIYSTCNLISSQ